MCQSLSPDKKSVDHSNSLLVIPMMSHPLSHFPHCLYLTVLVLVLILATPTFGVGLEEPFPQVRPSAPVDFQADPTTNYLYVVEQEGRILYWNKGAGAAATTSVFLDIRSRLSFDCHFCECELVGKYLFFAQTFF